MKPMIQGQAPFLKSWAGGQKKRGMRIRKNSIKGGKYHEKIL